MHWERLGQLAGLHFGYDTLVAFLPTLLTELIVLYLVLRRRFTAVRSSSRLDRPLPAHHLWVLPLQVWSLQTSWYSYRHIFVDLGFGSLYSEWIEAPLYSFYSSVLALGLVIVIQMTGVAVARSPGNALGLDGRRYTAFAYGFAAIALDVFFHQVLLRWI